MASFIGRLVTRIVGSVFRAGTVVDIPLSDDLMAKLTVLPVVAEVAATTMDDRVEAAFVSRTAGPRLSIPQARADNFAAVANVLRRCPCHRTSPATGRVWDWTKIPMPRAVRGAPLASSSVQFSLNGVHTNIYDEAYAVLPWICPNMLETRFMFRTEIGVPPALTLNSNWVAKLGLTDEPSHELGCKAHLNIPGAAGRMYADTLGYAYAPEGIYGYERSQGPLRCVYCWEKEVHFLRPAIWTAPLQNNGILGYRWLKVCWTINRQILDTTPVPSYVHVTAWARRFGSLELIVDFRVPTYVLVDTPEDWADVAAAGKIPVMAPTIDNGRSLGNLRVWVAAAVPIGVHCIVTDTRMKTSAVLDRGVAQLAPVECSPTHLNALCADMMTVAGGATNLWREMPITRAAVFASVWGLEEAALTRSTVGYYRVDVQLRAQTLLWDVLPRANRVMPVGFRGVVPGHWMHASGPNRSHTAVALRLVKAWGQATRTTVSWWIARALPNGTFDPDARALLSNLPQAPRASVGMPSTVGAAIAADIGMVNWYVFGSRGDVVPVMALAHRLAGWGVPVHVVRVHTEAEGNEVLAAVENGRILDAAPLFLTAMLAALSTQNVTFAPPEFVGCTLGVSLRPPTSITYPADFGVGWLFNFVLNTMLRTWAPIVNIGTFRGVGWLPRSADGVTFLKRSRNTNRPVDIMLAWGSSTLNKPEIDGAVEVQPGDHFAQFERAKVVVTHGGAGTVQTAAAAGARVVVATTVLDRRYRTPLDAGRGTDTGGDPDAVMLGLLPACSKIWIWAWKHSWAMFFRCFRWSLFWQFGPALWLFGALVVHVWVFHMPSLVVTQTVWGTVVASVLSKWMSPVWAMLIAPQLEQLALYIADQFGLSLMAVFLSLVRVLAAASASTMTWTLLFFGAGWWSIAAFLLVNTLRLPALMAAEMASLVFNWSQVEPSEGWAYLCISLAFPSIPVPLYHVRFVNRDRTRRFEGNWGTRETGNFAPYTVRVSRFTDSSPGEWMFQTRIPWSFFENAPAFTAPYSPVWNCQSSALAVTRGVWASLGIAGFVLLPTVIWGVLVAFVASIVAAILVVLLDVIPVLFIMLEAIGVRHYVSPTRAVCYNILEVVADAPGDWYGVVMALTVGMATGWAGGANDVEGRMSQVIRVWKATSRSELQELAIEFNNGGDRVARHILDMRLSSSIQ